MSTRYRAIGSDVLFVGATRPAMRWGVTYTALLFNLVFSLEAFLLSKDLRMLLLMMPIHGVCMLLCTRDPRIFDLALLWARTRIPAGLSNLWFWRASSYSPLPVSVTDPWGRRSRGSMPASFVTDPREPRS